MPKRCDEEKKGFMTLTPGVRATQSSKRSPQSQLDLSSMFKKLLLPSSLTPLQKARAFVAGKLFMASLISEAWGRT